MAEPPGFQKAAVGASTSPLDALQPIGFMGLSKNLQADPAKPGKEQPAKPKKLTRIGARQAHAPFPSRSGSSNALQAPGRTFDPVSLRSFAFFYKRRVLID